MKTIYAVQPLPKSIFLAGPTPREEGVGSWRPGALNLLEAYFNFDGIVYVPESCDWMMKNHYDTQITWEWEAISISTVVMFWVPRDLADMPAFTTNVEYGFMAASGKCVLGYPKNALKMNYLAALAERYHVPISHTLEETLKLTIQKTQYPYSTPKAFDKGWWE